MHYNILRSELISFLWGAIIPFSLLAVALVDISMFWHHNTICFVILLICLVVSVYIHCKETFYIILVVESFIYGMIGEHICVVYIKVWTYSNPSTIGLPIWLPLVWPLLMLTVGKNTQYIAGLLRYHRVELIAILLTLPVFISYLILLFVYQVHLGILAFYVLIAALIFTFLWKRSTVAKSEACAMFYISAFYGSCGEICLIFMGVWTYRLNIIKFSIAGTRVAIPLSLMYAWGTSAIALYIAAGLTELLLHHWETHSFWSSVKMAVADTARGLVLSTKSNALVR